MFREIRLDIVVFGDTSVRHISRFTDIDNFLYDDEGSVDHSYCGIVFTEYNSSDLEEDVDCDLLYGDAIPETVWGRMFWDTNINGVPTDFFDKEEIKKVTCKKCLYLRAEHYNVT